MAFMTDIGSIPVCESEANGVERTHVQLGQCTDDPQLKCNLRSGSLQNNTRRPSKIVRYACRGVNPQREGIPIGQFHQIVFSRRSNQPDTEYSSTWADQGDELLGGELGRSQPRIRVKAVMITE